MESSAAAPGFLPALIEAGKGVTFTMLGTTMRLIATEAETGGHYTVGEQVTPVGWGPPRHIHSREDMCRSTARSSTRLSQYGVFVITPSGLENYFIAVSKFGPLPPSPADLAKLAEPYGLTLLPAGL